jgi:hypothetical protein
MTLRRRAALALLAALSILAVPATASAVEYEVNSVGDQPDALVGTAGCLTIVPSCTLRAAIEESNNSTGIVDTIKFDSSFKGEVANDTIVISGAFPNITDKVIIDASKNGPKPGGRCEPMTGILGPCVQLERSDTGAGLVLAADEVEIESVAVVNATDAIRLFNGPEGVDIEDSWLGIELDGDVNANATGIFLDPESDFAFIGGPNEGERNVISGNTQGIDILGGSENSISGNYIGVKPDGTTPAPNTESVEITDSTASGGIPAVANEVGTQLSEPAIASAPCDGGCNVISGSSTTGIDLNGEGVGVEESPATGPTLVHGNYIGVNAPGTAVVANSTIGVWVGGADHVSVGGFDPGDTNYIVGGGEGITAESGSEDFKAIGNRIGFGGGGSELIPPSTRGIYALALSVTEEPEIENNVIRMTGEVGIEVRFTIGRIIGNEVEGGNRGIKAGVGDGGGLIASNDVNAPGEYGILIESPDNDIRSNTVTNSGGFGIAVKPPPAIVATNGNKIGGSVTQEENVIEGSNGAAIAIFEEAGEPGSTTEITRNHGALNGGLFIDLITGANEGILPPTVTAVSQSTAEGTAEPGTKVRVFRKAAAEAGELAGFLGETVATGGSWKVSFGTLPGGTRITATQTNGNGGTSELAASVTTPPDPPSGGGGNTGGGGNNNGGNNGGKKKDTTPPDTKITKGPPKKTHKKKVTFKFTSTEGKSTFQCKLDKKPFKACSSPKTYKKLKPGKHVFKVRAIDKAGNVDPTPAKRKFTVLR